MKLLFENAQFCHLTKYFMLLIVPLKMKTLGTDAKIPQMTSLIDNARK